MFLLDYFTDPILRAPTLATLLMGITSGLVGLLVFLRRESLLGETLSHATFPGALIGLWIAHLVGLESEQLAEMATTLSFSALSALLAIFLVHALRREWQLSSDAALCFVLALTFGIGVTLATGLQQAYPSLYRKATALLYGQAATMVDLHIYLYGTLALLTSLLLLLFYKELQTASFDRSYAASIGIPLLFIDSLLFLLIVTAVVMGIRTVGVVLISAMLIAPPVAARQCSDRLSVIFLLSPLFGAISAFFGIYISHELSLHWQQPEAVASRAPLILPTGPTIVVTAASFSFLALLVAPRRGLLIRLQRVARFRFGCLQENILKYIWRNRLQEGASRSELADYMGQWSGIIALAAWRLRCRSLLSSNGPTGFYELTPAGICEAEKIVRLHRLWELYLVNDVGLGAARVHRSAEEMEHLITPEIERKLTELLNNPRSDPHNQPIPSPSTQQRRP